MAKKKKSKTLHELKEELIEEDLENLEESNGKVEESPDEVLENLEYTDGKERDPIDLIEEEESKYGVDVISPFKTGNKDVFKRKLASMDSVKMQALAVRVAARQYANPEEQRDELMRAFIDWCSTDGSSMLSSVNQAVKTHEDVWADIGASGPAQLKQVLNQSPMSDLQAIAARLGFTPGYDRDKLIMHIKNTWQAEQR